MRNIKNYRIFRCDLCDNEQIIDENFVGFKWKTEHYTGNEGVIKTCFVCKNCTDAFMSRMGLSSDTMKSGCFSMTIEEKEAT